MFMHLVARTSIRCIKMHPTWLKKDSSKWIKTNGEAVRDFHWQDGYRAFSIGESQVRAVTDYIRGQKERHNTMTFEDELVALAKRYGVAFDPRYLWT